MYRDSERTLQGGLSIMDMNKILQWMDLAKSTKPVIFGMGFSINPPLKNL